MKPLFLVFEPLNHIYKVMEAAAAMGFDIMVFHTLALSTQGPYRASEEAMANTHRFADWADTESNFRRILELCHGRVVRGTYAALEVTLEVDARIREHFGLPGNPPALVRELLNKQSVRRRLAGAGLTQLRYFDEATARSMCEWPPGVQTLYFKPIMGTSSAYVARCTSFLELQAAVSRWDNSEMLCRPLLRHQLDSGGGFFLEEGADGELLSVEGYTYDGTYVPLGLSSRTLLARDTTVEMGVSFPYLHDAYGEIVNKVRRIHMAVGFRYGASHTEVIIGPNGEVELVELNIRFAGSDVLMLIDAAYGEKIEHALALLATGHDPGISLDRWPRQFASLQMLLPPRGVTRFDSIAFPGDNFAFSRISKPPGTALLSTDFQTDQIATYIVCGPTYSAALEAALTARKQVRVNGVPLGEDANNVVF